MSKEISQHTDFFDQPIEIGDSVAFIAPVYRHLVMGTVISFTPKGVRVMYLNTWNHGAKGREDDHLCDPKSVINRYPNLVPSPHPLSLASDE